jgi:anti-sigma regulatory factor (Ser/Thr protein kinase)
MDRAVVEVELPRDRAAARRARSLLEELSTDAGDHGALDTAKLLASELVNNAVMHGQGKITLRASLDEDRVYVEVIDEGSGFERVIREDEFDRLGGWGLQLVDAKSARWGVHEGTTHVWFEIERSGPRVGEDKNPLGDDPD